jgi:AAA domain, putative AbiEii toxin, Type IV TA system
VEQYGSLPANFTYDLREGYTALLGPNNAGKSTLLQFLFRSLFADPSEVGPTRLALILPDHEYVDATTQTGDRTLELWNRDLNAQIQNRPLPHGGTAAGPQRSELARLLWHGDFLDQLENQKGLLAPLGFHGFALKQAQQIYFDDIVLSLQGSGLRSSLPILAAITNPDVRVILIDQPESSLEPRLQKTLRDILIKASETKIIVVATHSHLLVRRDLVQANQVVGQPASGQTSVRTLDDDEELYDLVFNLLGNSTEDLLFPGNYLVVEGSSDQQIVVRVLELLGAPQTKVKVLTAGGIDGVQGTVESVRRALVPVVVNDSPYAKRVVALIDKPDDPSKQNRLKHLGNRLFVLDQPSIEEYLPEALYTSAERDKAEDLAEILRLKGTGDRQHLDELKREISTALAASLEEGDLSTIPLIRDAAQKAMDKAF